MDTRHAVLLAVRAETSGKLVGRTLLQKKLFFASRLVGTDIGFSPHYYGPYSQEVADATDSDVMNRFLEEQVEIFPESNVFGERRRHSYKITPDGEKLLASVDSQPETAEWRQALLKINDHPLAANYNLLSIAAKMMTILTDIKRGTAAEISSQAPKYGWKLTPAQIDDVADFLHRLGLTLERQKDSQH